MLKREVHYNERVKNFSSSSSSLHSLLTGELSHYAHSQMHPHVDAADYQFKDADGLNGVKGNAEAGAALVQSNCIACHSIESQGFPQVMDNASSAAAYGVVPPDLSFCRFNLQC